MTTVTHCEDDRGSFQSFRELKLDFALDRSAIHEHRRGVRIGGKTAKPERERPQVRPRRGVGVPCRWRSGSAVWWKVIAHVKTWTSRSLLLVYVKRRAVVESGSPSAAASLSWQEAKDSQQRLGLPRIKAGVTSRHALLRFKVLVLEKLQTRVRACHLTRHVAGGVLGDVGPMSVVGSRCARSHACRGANPSACLGSHRRAILNFLRACTIVSCALRDTGRRHVT